MTTEDQAHPAVLEAEATLAAVLKRVTPRGRLQLGWWRRWTARRRLARLDSYLETATTDLRALRVSGMLHRRLGEKDRAVSALAICAHHYPDSIDLAWESANADLWTGNPTRAAQTVSATLGHHPGDWNLLWLAGVINLLRKDLAGAEYSMNRALSAGAPPDKVGPILGMIEQIRLARIQFPISMPEIYRFL